MPIVMITPQGCGFVNFQIYLSFHSAVRHTLLAGSSWSVVSFWRQELQIFCIVFVGRDSHFKNWVFWVVTYVFKVTLLDDTKPDGFLFLMGEI